MINLKVAEYNKNGKFQGFLELGKDFLFGGESVVFHNPSNQSKYKYIDAKGVAHINYKLDYKDPLNRFGGLFNGLTYGEGRFVLCESIGVKDKNQKDVWAFDIAKLKPFDSKLNYKLISNKKFLFGMGCMDGYVGCDGYGYDFTNVNFSESFDNDNADLRNEIVANLFENPELYEKLK